MDRKNLGNDIQEPRRHQSRPIRARLPGVRRPLNWALGTKNNWGGGIYGSGSDSGTIWAPYKNGGGLERSFPQISKAQLAWGDNASVSLSTLGAKRSGARGLFPSPVLVTVLGGTAGWGAWAGISGHRDSLERTVVPRAGFQGQITHLDSALEIATESLPLISKTAQRYLFPIPTHLMSLLTQR